jgi:hypothetical protein
MVTAAYEEFVTFIASGTTPEQIASYRPSAAQQERAYELLNREKQGELTIEEKAELDTYISLEHILRLAKAKAKLLLKTQGSPIAQ